MRPVDRGGLVWTAGAFAIWGLAPIFWKQIQQVPVVELLAHRVLWCAVLITGWVALHGGLGPLLRSLRRGRLLLGLLTTALLVGSNWAMFVWAVTSGQILAASLGYFITPLLNVLLGLAVLRESLSRAQWISVGLATVGVVVLVVGAGELPWLSLAMGLTFALYGLLRKTLPVEAAEGLAVETILLSPLAFGLIADRHLDGIGAFLSGSYRLDLMLLGAGVITLVPLLWFTKGARRIPLSWVGILQYLAPTGQFLVAVLLYGEPLGALRLAAFVLVWMALALFTWEALLGSSGRRRAAAA